MPARHASNAAHQQVAWSTADHCQIALAIVAGIGWSWAFCLLAARVHFPESYLVITPKPPAWGFLALPIWQLALIGAAGVGLCVWLAKARNDRRRFRAAVVWSLAAWLIPLGDISRLSDLTPSPPVTFFEPLFFVLITGNTFWQLANARESIAMPFTSSDRACLGLVLVLVTTAVAWWYWQGARAFDDFLLGYHDFGHFARRVVNTWEGRGWLRETPSLPAYWDHFNPSLATLAPLWWAWPSARLFIFLQAVCLASPALPVYGIARQWSAPPPAAMLFALAYLMYPSVGMMNLNYSYGWHPVSLALPLIFAVVWLVLREHFVSAILVALFACGFKETVLVTMACLCLAMALQAKTGGKRSRPAALLARRLSWKAWTLAGAGFSATFVAVFKLSAFAEFQTSRFSNLGDSVWQILASPLMRPEEFWGQIIRPGSAYFLLALLLPLGWRWLRRGWPILLAAGVTLGVLLAWTHVAATSIAFQYVTTVIPIVFVAAIAGSAGLKSADMGQHSMLAAGLTAAIACATASVFFGGLPISSETMTVMKAQTYRKGDEIFPSNPRAAGTEANRHLRDIIRQIVAEDAAVLATGRIAAHLLAARRLESADEARKRWQALAVEAGDGKAAIEVFDWVVLDTLEQFQQSQADVDFLSSEAIDAGYEVKSEAYGILVLRRP